MLYRKRICAYQPIDRHSACVGHIPDRPTGLLASGRGGAVTVTHSRSQSDLHRGGSSALVVMLTAAGMFIRSYLNVESVTTGF